MNFARATDTGTGVVADAITRSTAGQRPIRREIRAADVVGENGTRQLEVAPGPLLLALDPSAVLLCLAVGEAAVDAFESSVVGHTSRARLGATAAEGHVRGRHVARVNPQQGATGVVREHRPRNHGVLYEERRLQPPARAELRAAEGAGRLGWAEQRQLLAAPRIIHNRGKLGCAREALEARRAGLCRIGQ